MPNNTNENNNFINVETLKEPILDFPTVIQLNFNDEVAVEFLSTCFEKNIPANTCGEMESFEDYPFLCSSVSSGGSFMLMYEANTKRTFLIPIDKDKKNMDIQVENINSLTSLIEAKLEKCAKEIKKCAKDSNKTYNATILIINGENIYNKESLINELEKSNINYNETKFSPGESKNIGMSVHLSKGKNSSIRVKLFPFSGNLIYFPDYPKIPDVKKNHQQADKVEFSIKLDGRNISLQYDKNDYLNAITRYHTINPKSPNSDQKWVKFLGEKQLKIFNEIFAKIKNSYPEYERILIGGEFCPDRNTLCSGFFIHSLRGIQGEKIEFLDIKKIHKLSKESFPDFFSEAKENEVKIYFMRQWFNKIDSLPSNKEECKQLLDKVMSSLYDQDSSKKAKAIKNGLEGVVAVDINSYWPILKIKFDQHQDLNFDQLEKTKKSTKFDLTETCDDILRDSRLTKIEKYFFEENKGMENTISWAIADIIKELQAGKLFAGPIKKNILRIKERLETNIKEHLNKKSPSQLSSVNSTFFNLKDEAKMSQNLPDTNETTVLTK